MVHIEPITFTVRFFDDGQQWGDPYRLVLTVQKIEHEGYVSACLGDMTTADYHEFRDAMKEFGITRLRWRRYAARGEQWPRYLND